jgi:hypothetical protein
MRLPSFLIIGAMKAATSTLHEQLGRQPGIFLPELKEPNFFSDDANYARGIEWYASQFAEAKPESLLGEVSTHYTKRPTHPHTIERMREWFESPRFIYVMRHPVDRLISQYMHQCSEGEIKCDLEVAIERHPELIHYSRYAFQIEPYLAAFGEKSVLPVIFERLTRDPDEEFARICEFIGYEGQPQWDFGFEPDNVSAQRVRKFPLYDLFIGSQLGTSLRRNLVPKRARTFIRERLMMGARPVLPLERRRALEQEFNEDLSALAPWLGGPISCESFK